MEAHVTLCFGTVRRRRYLPLLLLSIVGLFGCAQIHASRGWSYLNRRDPDPDQAIAEFKRSGQLSGALIGLSTAHYQKGELAQSEHYLEEALSKYPDDWTVIYQKGLHCLRVSQNYDCAIHYLERCRSLEVPGIRDTLDALITEALESKETRGQPIRNTP